MTKHAFVRTDHLDRQPAFTPREALALCRHRVENKATKCFHNQDVVDNCGHNAGCNYGFSTCGATTAAGIWPNTPAHFRRPGLEAMMSAPAGAVLVWKGGTHGFGHAGIKGEGRHVYGTDLPVRGEFGRIRIDEVTDHFTLLEPLGWVFPVFHFASADAGRKPPKVRPEEPRRRFPNLDDIVRLQEDTIEAARRAVVQHERRSDDRALFAIVQSARDQIAAANALRVSTRKATAKKATAKKATAKKATAKKATAKKATAKKTT